MTFRPLAINDRLKLVIVDGRPTISGLGLNPQQVEDEVRKWQAEHQDHARFHDSELWMEAYEPQLDAFKRIFQQVALGDKERSSKEKLTKEAIKAIEALGNTRDQAERWVREWIAMHE
jgi:hypothetical protein